MLKDHRVVNAQNVSSLVTIQILQTYFCFIKFSVGLSGTLLFVKKDKSLKLIFTERKKIMINSVLTVTGMVNAVFEARKKVSLRSQSSNSLVNTFFVLTKPTYN